MRLTPPRCRICKREFGTPPLALGRLPICNRFTTTGDADAEIDLDVVECSACQLIQLRKAPPPGLLTPQVPWIRYREPEGHLDALAEELLALRPSARTALGAGPFEQPLLSRLAARGLTTRAVPLDAGRIEGRFPYLESWQASLNDPHLAKIAAEAGVFDIVSCRYIVEHTPEPVAALAALGRLLRQDGLLLIEVPDSGQFLAARDYCFLWEEHSCYFVEDTLRRLAETAGYRVLALRRYPGALEDALVMVLQPTDDPDNPRGPAVLGPSRLFQAYRDGFLPPRATPSGRGISRKPRRSRSESHRAVRHRPPRHHVRERVWIGRFHRTGGRRRSRQGWLFSPGLPGARGRLASIAGG